ncbi:hypothetical protein TVNIR_2403 [Thioalkalivibrio nitratireducens DSM 14787]|uniref:DUF1499 domain-containing protein n=1 Tax=Thioalkalivibrio nitratireducens (strain DSM 14787 / UNIQEM 213 / ALEN2) TaxID=1255043 RepID=L0E092_THIND|nr:DUF1499 domain-containing protein [Thioalkalivibrio nitratireducens]AGA34046.1 hypothetical protein TVNIR_2403 [Thioalkalivibrio nitratireducens DSM 14787]
MTGARVAFLIALLAALLLLVSGPGTRLSLWEFSTGFLLMRWSVHLGLAALALVVVFTLAPRLRRRDVGWRAAALVLALGSVYIPWQALERAREVPPIHDITTDTADPPRFEAILELRATAPNPAAYPGETVAQQQRQAYPDIRTLVLEAPPERVLEQALDAAQTMGWDIVAVDPREGRIEAVATTFWYGFKDDVVIRVTPDGATTRVDVRSVSRVGRSDAGTNARRIRTYFERLQESN